MQLANALVIPCGGDGESFVGSVVVEDGLITHADPGGDSRADRILDLEGHTILPGFIDLHSHLTFRRTVGSPWGLHLDPEGLSAIRAARNALTLLRQGVTTIRELGAPHDLNLVVRDAIRRGIMPGPRMVCAGTPISVTGGHATSIALTADGPEGFRALTRSLLSGGAEWIKVIASNDPLREPLDGEYSHPEIEQDELTAVVQTARRWGGKVAAHTMGSETIRMVASVGVDTIEHGVYLDEAGVAEMKRRNVALVPTLSGYLETTLEFWQRGEQWMANHKYLVQPHKESFQLAVQEGVFIAFGTDSVGELVTELELMVDYGMAVEDSLQAATLNSARVLGLGASLGSVEVGKIADLCIVEGNPLEDLQDLRKVRYVMQAGRVWRPTGIRLPSGDDKGISEPWLGEAGLEEEAAPVRTVASGTLHPR
jgi:imidazolonepropionase-like amidohydrolase